MTSHTAIALLALGVTAPALRWLQGRERITAALSEAR